MKPNHIPMPAEVIRYFFLYENGALIWQNRTGTYLGLFDTEEGARSAYVLHAKSTREIYPEMIL